MLTVVAAIMERDGKVLICQRRRGASHELKWEFPGGKVEPYEHPKEALRRELNEELGIDAVIGAEVTRYEYQYPGKPAIQLIFLRVDNFLGEPVNRIFHDIRWELPAKFPEYDFLDGDVDFVRRLARGAS